MLSSKFRFFVYLTLVPYLVYTQNNISHLSTLEFAEGVHDIWGYVAEDGTEYALLGLHDGVSIISLDDPENPKILHKIKGSPSTLRDIKIYNGFAYVTRDYSDESFTPGIRIIDLRNLPNQVKDHYWSPDIDELGQLTLCHNIYIDEYGYGYLAGCNLNSGGILIIDLFTDPENPTYVSKGIAHYTHDIHVRENIIFSSELEEGKVAIYDASDKNNLTLFSNFSTPSERSHNAWLSPNGNYLFTTDVLAGSYVGSYDVSDYNDVILLDKYKSEGAIISDQSPHIAHVYNDWLIISYYNEGCVILDVSKPDNLVKVGNFNPTPATYETFHGIWGIYPHLPSGIILATDYKEGKEGALYILKPTYVKAWHIDGTITDADTGMTIPEASITIDVEAKQIQKSSNGAGTYKLGHHKSGTYTAVISKEGYQTESFSFDINNGESIQKDMTLQPILTSTTESSHPKIDSWPNPSQDHFILQISDFDKFNGKLHIHNINGQQISKINLQHNRIEYGHNLISGIYIVSVLDNEHNLAFRKKIIKL